MAAHSSSTARASPAPALPRSAPAEQACRAGTIASSGVASPPHRTRSSAWDAPVFTLFELFLIDDDEHRHARCAHHRDEEPQRGVGAVVGVRIVDDVAAGLPECLTGLDHPRCLALQLKE